MKENKKQLKVYIAPSVKVVSFTVEQGFAGSGVKAEKMLYDRNTDDYNDMFFPRNQQ